MNTLYPDAAAAVEGVPFDGMTIVAAGSRDLTVASDDAGIGGVRDDLSIVEAWKADESGNLLFRKTARNFDTPAAICGKVCIAEGEKIVPGAFDPDAIHLPGGYVQRLVPGAPCGRTTEQRTTRQRETA